MAITAGAGLALAPHGLERLLSTEPAAALAGAAPDDLWIDGGRPTAAAADLLAALRKADTHGIDPAGYPIAEIESALARATNDRSARERAEALLTEALLAYVRALRVPARHDSVTYIDAELAPAVPDAADLLTREALARLHAFGPLYEDLRRGLAWYRIRWSTLPQTTIPSGPPLSIGSEDARVSRLRQRLGVAPGAEPERFDHELAQAVQEFRKVHGLAPGAVADGDTIDALNAGSAHYERLIVANMDRARALPADGRRHIIVDTAGAVLRVMEDGRQVDTMRVVVGSSRMQTPELAGLIRFAVFEPYWNIPPDLVRDAIAPAVLRDGSAVLTQRRLVLSSDWRSYAPVQPEAVDWSAVAAGRDSIWIRQVPGGDNVLGRVKFMLPNTLGIYLHDTPNKANFRRSDRRLSSGCVRVEDAQRLAQWLFRDRTIMNRSYAPDEHVDLPEPVPVYITYLTAAPEDGEIRFRKDVYGRERGLRSRFGHVT